MKVILIASLVQKLKQFWLTGGFYLEVELHREGSAPAACAAGLSRKVLAGFRKVSVVVWRVSSGVRIVSAGVKLLLGGVRNVSGGVRKVSADVRKVSIGVR